MRLEARRLSRPHRPASRLARAQRGSRGPLLPSGHGAAWHAGCSKVIHSAISRERTGGFSGRPGRLAPLPRDLRRDRSGGALRHARRRRLVLRRLPPRRRTRREVDTHPGLGLRQPHTRRLERGGPIAPPRGLPELARPAAPRARDPRAGLGLPAAVRARSRDPADLRARVEAAPPGPRAIRRHPSRGGVSAPEARGRRRQGGVRRGHRPDRAALGHSRARPGRPPARQRRGEATRPSTT